MPSSDPTTGVPAADQEQILSSFPAIRLIEHRDDILPAVPQHAVRGFRVERVRKPLR